MHSDKRIIGRVGPFLVHGNVQEVQLRDGSRHRLQTVSRNGLPDQFMRALPDDDGRQVSVFDVRKLVKDLAAELPAAPERDKPGLIWLSFRARFADKVAFRQAVADAYEVLATPVPDEIAAVAA